MKKWMFLVCLSGMLLSLSSCSSYYYSTLASNDPVRVVMMSIKIL